MAQSDEISLRELTLLVWRAKWLIMPIILLCMLAAGGVALMLPTQYEATVLISPVSSNSGSGKLGGGQGGLGGLASIVGLSLDSDSGRSESIAMLESEVLTDRYIQDNNLLPVLFPKLWDPVSKRWRVADPRRVPTLWKGNKVFMRIRKVAEDRKTMLVKMTITWTDAATAAKWANDLVKVANDYLREKAIRESEQHIAYLKEEAAKSDVAQLRNAIYTLIESEIKNVMLAKGPGDYSLKVLDPAFPPERKSFPRLSIFLPVGLVVGIIISTLFLIVRRAWHADSAAN